MLAAGSSDMVSLSLFPPLSVSLGDRKVDGYGQRTRKYKIKVARFRKWRVLPR